MRRKIYSRQFFQNMVIGVLFFLSILAIIKTLFVSTDIDESYAVAAAYRLLNGDAMFGNMWEPHQMSAWLPALLLWPYKLVFGDLEYSVLFLRVAGTTLHLVGGVFVFAFVRKRLDVARGLLFFLIHMNFLPKWLQIPEFEWMNYMMLLVAFVLGLTCLEGRWEFWKLCLLGMMMALQLLNYPTMILLYPFYMYALFRESDGKVRYIAISTIAAIIVGCAFLVYLFSGTTGETFLVALKYIFADPSHAEKSIWVRFSEYVMTLSWDILCSACVLAGLYAILLLVKGIDWKQRVVFALKVEIIFYSVVSGIGMVFGDQNQFFLQSRYLICVVLGVFCYYTGERNKLQRICMFFGIVPGVVSMFATLLVTNMTINVAYSKLFIGVIASLVIVCSSKEGAVDEWLNMCTVFATIMTLIVCKLVLIRVTGCVPVTMRATLEKLDYGAWKGIYVVDDLAKKRNDNYELLSKYVEAGDTMLYFGCDTGVYVDMQVNVGASSVQGTAVFNQDFVDYYAEFPGKYPSIVVVDKKYQEDYYFVYSPYNYILKEWIENDYNYTEMVETENLKIYMR